MAKADKSPRANLTLTWMPEWYLFSPFIKGNLANEGEKWREAARIKSGKVARKAPAKTTA